MKLASKGKELSIGAGVGAILSWLLVAGLSTSKGGDLDRGGCCIPFSRIQ